MKDRVSLYPGRVKLTPVAGQENVFDLTRADQPTQEGTALNKGNLLADDTAGLFGLDDAAVPDDVLKLLSRFQAGLGNEYVWAKIRPTVSLGDAQTLTNQQIAVWSKNNSNNNTAIQYADTAEDALKGHTQQIQAASFSTQADYITWINANLPGKWFYTDFFNNYTRSGLLYFPQGATASVYDQYFIKISTVDLYANAAYIREIVGYVNAKDSAAFSPANDDGYEYFPLGKIGGSIHVEMSSYVGTGTYGPLNPTVIHFSKKPAFFLVISDTGAAFWSRNYPGNIINIDSNSYGVGIVSLGIHWNDNTITIYTTDYADNVTTQLNRTIQYNVIAFIEEV